MNFIKKFIGASSTDEVASITSGKLYLTRSKTSPKGAIECLYNDAYASIKQTTNPFFYQLCITKVYQEGENEFRSNSGFNYSDDEDEDYEETDGNSSIVRTSSFIQKDSKQNTKDEWIFPINEELKIFKKIENNNKRSIAWKDLNGDLGDKFEFVLDDEIRNNDFDSFMMTIYKCLYEEKYHESSISVNSLDQLKEFIYNPKSELLNFEDLEYDEDEDDESDTTEDYGDAQERESPKLFVSDDEEEDPHPKGEVVYASKKFALHLYDSTTGSFLLKSSTNELEIIDLGNWEFTLFIIGEKIKINSSLTKNMNPTFNYEHLSFIFNHYLINKDQVIANSWLLKFNNFNDLNEFQNKFLASMYESLNKKKFGIEKGDDDYFVDAFSSLELNEEEVSEPEDSESDEDVENSTKEFSDKKDKNTYLSVGYKDRAYVSRGDKIGVFSQDDKSLKYQTTINNITDLKGKKFNPEKMLLHQEDSNLVMYNPEFNNKSLYKLDLNRGKIVEEWKISETIPLKNYAPSEKFAPLTNQQTLTGISSNGLFTIDPRLSGSKLVNDQTHKCYKTNNNQFQTLATTDQGHIALGSGKGDIRLFDRLGVNAKTALPSLGDPILGIDVSKDGRWILATCKTYILLIDTNITGNQKNSGKTGFTAFFDKDKKPIPRRLCLLPEHEAFIKNNNPKNDFNFSSAYFNTGVNQKETSIISSVDNYIVTWSLSKILKNDPSPYQVKNYKQNIVADNFKFGSNNRLIISLPDDVNMIKKSSLNNPIKEFHH
ncbi:VID27 [Candida pseudojiufengensis]|uniref:VID27 n=1 Tax=Candida pseudojiufengensis TaxID=497109 RepID=UPI0022257DAC|nr:VID27 [Candida pseudojiufengensis]KAI5962962.1 VID27 [Candida pseudojiufengensis]